MLGKDVSVTRKAIFGDKGWYGKQSKSASNERHRICALPAPNVSTIALYIFRVDEVFQGIHRESNQLLKLTHNPSFKHGRQHGVWVPREWL